MSTPVTAPPATSPRRAFRVAAWTAFLLAAFAYRLGFGLCHEFFSDDETQIFLIGLRHYAKGVWPYFGADVVWTRSQIPGALQGLLVGLPFHVAAVPEAPFVLLNLLSFAGIGLFAWYVRKRLPRLPRWLVWGWLLFIPWTLNYGTHVLNPDYLLCASIVFFVGFFEALPGTRVAVIPLSLAHAMMGAAVLWVMQIHMSWPLLGPFVLIILWSRLREGGRSVAAGISAFLLGAAVTGSLLVPTFWKFGLLAGSGGTHRNLSVHVESPFTVLSTLARMMSFASLEVGRFLGIDTPHRVQLLADHKWLIPATAVAWVAGLAQPVWMAISWFRGSLAPRGWASVKWLLLGSVVLTYFSYWFVMEPPQAHAFYVLAPVGFMYAFYCWSFIDSRRWRVVAAVVLVVSIVYHAGMVIARAPERSLYTNRTVAAAAVTHKMPELLGHRRPFAMEGAPSPDVFVTRGGLSDLRLEKTSWSRGLGGMLLWTVTIRNEGTRYAYRDLWCEVRYHDASGRADTHSEVMPEVILQPGERVTFTGINDGYIAPFQSADITFAQAQRVVPLSAVNQPTPQ